MAEECGKSLISLKKAGKIYGTVTALKKIDLDIHKGQSITIFGSNGAGKSTLALKNINFNLLIVS